MTSLRDHVRRVKPVVFSLIALAAASSGNCQTRDGVTNALLTKPAPAMHCTIALRELLSVINRASSLNASASAALLDRQITVDSVSGSVEDLLNNICELNRWSWSTSGPGKILITRTLPASGAIIAEKMAASMAQDLRLYSGLDALLSPPADIKPSEMVAAIANKAMAHPVRPVIRAVREKTRTLRESLKGVIEDRKPVPYSSLTAAQQSLLVDVLFLDAISKIVTENDELGSVPDYIRNPQHATIAIENGNALLIGSTVQRNGFLITSGFPTVLPGLKYEPTQLDPKMQALFDDLRKQTQQP
jgi:hypothetical protein